MKAGRVEDRDQDGGERQVGFRSFSIPSGHNASRFGAGDPFGWPLYAGAAERFGRYAAATEPFRCDRGGPDFANLSRPGRLAQLGEHQLDKLGVTGSSPVPPTRGRPANAGLPFSEK
jgi:hypothetical protein